jgi:endonuclease YncB( thermonuclease family)
MNSIFDNYNNDIPFFSLKGINSQARVVNIIDGDTVVVILNIFNGFYKFYTRLINIDTCEIHSSNLELKEKGNTAKYRVIELITKNKYNNLSKKDIIKILNENVYIVNIECDDFDKYGRLLANIFVDEKNIGDILVDEKLAYRYYGDKKLSEIDQLKNLA